MTLQDHAIWSVKRLLDWTTQYLAEKDFANPRLNVEWLLSDTLHCKRLDLYMDVDRPLSAAELEAFKERLKRRVNREPLQYIVGKTDFMGLTFEVNSSVLIPRPDTELLVEKTLESCMDPRPSPIRILDLGTGSGAIAIAVASFLQKRHIEAEVTGLDISPEAIRVAERNAARLLRDASLTFVVADVFRLGDGFNGRFDLVVSNPPYVSDLEYDLLPEEVRNYEPSVALRAADNGLIFYQHISNLSPRLLNPTSVIRTCLFEVGYNQEKDVRNILNRAGFSPVVAYRDYGGHFRVVKGQSNG